MHKGIYIALSGAVLKQNQIEIIAQNLANIHTLGYRREYMAFADYLINESNKISEDKVMTKLNKVVFDLSRGDFLKTDKPLDIAIEGEGFIELEGNRYTRRGDLKIDDDGFLVNFKGYKVMGKNGAIKIQNKTIPKIKIDGKVEVDGDVIDEIKIVTFDDLSNLEKIDSSIYTSKSPAKEIKANILQGFVETSNVSPVYEMINMIQALRDFESYQKAVQVFDESINKVINELARI